MYTLVCSLKICCSLLGYSIVVVQWALNSPVLVRFKVPQPYKNTLPTVGGTLDMSIRVSVFLYGGLSGLGPALS